MQKEMKLTHTQHKTTRSTRSKQCIIRRKFLKLDKFDNFLYNYYSLIQHVTGSKLCTLASLKFTFSPTMCVLNCTAEIQYTVSCDIE